MIECRALGSQRYIAGIMVPWDERISVLGQPETFRRGAFRRQFGNRKVPPILLHYQHHVERLPIGRLTEARDVEGGMWGEFRLGSGTIAREAWALAKDGILDGLSVSFVNRTNGSGPHKRGGQGDVTDALIDHVALTHQPAYSGARVNGTSERDPQADRRTLEDHIAALIERRSKLQEPAK